MFLVCACCYLVQSDHVGFNIGNREKLSSSQAKSVQLLGYSLISLHFRCWILLSHLVCIFPFPVSNQDHWSPELRLSSAHSMHVCIARVNECFSLSLDCPPPKQCRSHSDFMALWDTRGTIQMRKKGERERDYRRIRVSQATTKSHKLPLEYNFFA